MNREILFRGKRTVNGEWVEGYYTLYPQGFSGKGMVSEHVIRDTWELIGKMYFVEPETVCQYTGLTDKNSRKIFNGDIVKLVLPAGEIRYFKVSIKSVVRKVLCHPDFDDEFSKVEITGVVFEWNGYELFPCVDTYGVPDYSMMEVIGNIFDNPELVTTK